MEIGWGSGVRSGSSMSSPMRKTRAHGSPRRPSPRTSVRGHHVRQAAERALNLAGIATCFCGVAAYTALSQGTSNKSKSA
jgi:hypothetical protein